MHKLQPVSHDQRVWVMDALRGIAILGIFIMNLPGLSFYNSNAPHTSGLFSVYDHNVKFIEDLLMEGKFYSIFSFLFGWGIALQLARGKDDSSQVKLVRRRLLIMFILGMAHLQLLWYGDIVAFYALLGFVLLWMRKWSDKTLLITAIILLLSPILLYFLKMKFHVLNWPSEKMFEIGSKFDLEWNNIKTGEDYIHAIHNGNYFSYVKVNANGAFFRYGDLFFQSRIPKVLGMFILGYLMGRNGRYKSVMKDTALLIKVAVIGLLIGIPANYYMVKFSEGPGYYNLTPDGLRQTVYYALGVAPLALAYISLFLLVASRRQTSSRRHTSLLNKHPLQLLSPVGKMAFTNYMTHSLIGVIVFTGAGFAMDGKAGPVYYTIFALIVFICQIILSTIWFRYFEYGPVEWIWRSATYGKRQSFRKKTKT